MRASDSRLAERLMFVAWVTTNLSQRIGGRPVHHPAPVTFILSQLGADRTTTLDLNFMHSPAGKKKSAGLSVPARSVGGMKITCNPCRCAQPLPFWLCHHLWSPASFRTFRTGAFR